MSILFGFRLNDDDFDLEIEPGRIIILRAVVRSLPPGNLKAKLVIQDKTKNWEIESLAIDKSGWQQYAVAKRVRGNAKNIRCGILWEPENLTDSLEVRKFQIIVN